MNGAESLIKYSSEEVDYQENLLGKLMTLDHVINLVTLCEPNDSWKNNQNPYIKCLKEISLEYKKQYARFINLKRGGKILGSQPPRKEKLVIDSEIFSHLGLLEQVIALTMAERGDAVLTPDIYSPPNHQKIVRRFPKMKSSEVL